MKKIRAILLVIGLLVAQAGAQTPTGTVAGMVTDSSGAIITRARISITNKAGGIARNVNSSSEGFFSASTLPSGVYSVTAESPGFAAVECIATVEAGITTTVDLILPVASINQASTVTDAAPLLHYESHAVSGVVARNQIESLPLNGRNFLDLAKLEPGVTSPVRGTTNRIFVPILGAGDGSTPRVGYTRFTVDGGDISIVGTFGAALQVSQEVVQEFQISTVNFDPATSVTTSGAVNIVTRSGGNNLHGGGFYFYRDHNLAAYPGLERDPTNPTPFFQRKQYGYQLGGPIRRDRLFFFSTYERNDQRGVESIQPRTPEFSPLGGVFPSPAVGNQLTVRFDALPSPNHTVFARYTHDGNRAFAPNGQLLPSGWTRITNWADQSLLAVTSVLSPTLVNDARFSYFFISPRETPAGEKDCRGCFGLGAPRINIQDAGLSFGNARRISGPARRYQLTESLTWQRGTHRLRFGFDWEHSTVSVELLDRDPATIDLYSPNQVRDANAILPPESRIPLPASFTTLEDVLRLPLRSFVTAVGPGLFLQREFHKNRLIDLYRLYAADTWHFGPRLTMNYGLGWSYEPNVLNTDLGKPNLLIPILGPRGLSPPSARAANVAPSLGFAWATRDGKTVVRAGAGRYFDPASFNSTDIANERLALSPSGTGRRTVPGSAVFYNGAPLNFRNGPTTFTGADLLDILAGIRAGLAQRLSPENRDFTFRNINLNKTGSNLADPLYETPYALHFSAGVQRELARDLVFSADFAWRRFLHTFISDVDYNRFNRSPEGPVIARCIQAQSGDLKAVCSNGPITFDNTTGIARYKGLIVRVEKRLSRGTQFLVSYALGSYVGTNGAPGPTAPPATGFNYDDWFENYGPLPSDQRHTLNLSGLVELPSRFQLSFNVSVYSAPPLSVYVEGMDFNGDGTANDLLPGTKVNQFNRGLGKSDLVHLVKNYNVQFAGKVTAGGQIAPQLTLPGRFRLNDGFFTQDVRLSRSFAIAGERLRLALLGEVFNLLNTANLVDYDGNIANPATFGQPTGRYSQVFGSGGPRTFQFGARFTY